MNPIYNAAISLYSLGARVVAKRKPKARKMIDGQRCAFDYLRKTIIPGDKYIWIHVASLGEFEQGRPLIEMIKRNFPEQKILLTFFSPSGYEVRKNYDKVDAVCYLPFDFKHNARELLDIVNPQMAIFVKYEFWGNYLQELHRRDIPIYLISAIFRPKQSFFQWWGGMFRNMLRCYTHLYVQDNASKELLSSIDVTNVTVAGDTRFDRVTDIMSTTAELPLISQFKKSAQKIFIAGSSWEADEQIYTSWLNSSTMVKAIIAPHEFDGPRLASLRQSIANSVLWSEIKDCNSIDFSNIKCIIIDCFGMLASLYRYADIAYVGGGFGAGIHNINEAAVYGIPVIFGPKHHKFKEARDLIEAGGGFSISNVTEFESTMGKLADDAFLTQSGHTAAEYIKRNLGATKKIFSDLFRR